MRQSEALREFMNEYFPGGTKVEGKCSCGAPNHVRVLFFRVDGQPAAVVLPEGMTLGPAELKQQLGCMRVEPLDPIELEDVYVQYELGRTPVFENPFRSAVYFDDALAACDEIVICPRMFLGEEGSCVRIPTAEFLKATHARELPLTCRPLPEVESWAV